MRKQIVDSILDLFLVRIFEAHRFWVKLGFALAGLLVAHNSFAIPIYSPPWKLAADKIEIGSFGPLAGWAHFGELSLEQRANSLDNIYELLSPGQSQSIPVVQPRASDGAESKGEERKQPGIRSDKNINFIEHYPGLSLIAFNFLLGISLPLILGFASHARNHGINNAWRDLVFTWPIPYWMRFVPEDERGRP